MNWNLGLPYFYDGCGVPGGSDHLSHVVVVVVGIDEGLGCTWVCGLGLSVCILGGGMVLCNYANF